MESPSSKRDPRTHFIAENVERNFGLNLDGKDSAQSTLNELDPENNWDSIWRVIRDTDLSETKGIERDSTAEVLAKSERVRSAFIFAWNGYVAGSLGHDGVHPVTGTVDDSWGHLGATLVDALDTLLIMDLREEYGAALGALQSIDFGMDLKASFFETTIRCLGGLLSAFEMSGDAILLSAARTLGDGLLRAFETPNGVPKSMVNLKSGAIENYQWNGGQSVLAEIGSNQLEFYSLSSVSGDAKYLRTSRNVYRILDSVSSYGLEKGAYSRSIPIDLSKASRHSGIYSWGGMSDSFYEYTLKSWILSGYEDQTALKMYVEAVGAAKERLLRMVHDDKRRDEPYYFLGERRSSGSFVGEMEELQCFAPGLLALGAFHANIRWKQSQSGGRELSEHEQALWERREEDLKLAHVLVASCSAMFSEMATGLAPESISFDRSGWNGDKMKYQLRPETVESLFILHSLTGNPLYREWGWSIFEAIDQHCRTDIAFSGLINVDRIPPQFDDQMQSYFFSETLKYLYLMFNDEAAAKIPLDRFVFNTEAHPLRVMEDFPKFVL